MQDLRAKDLKEMENLDEKTAYIYKRMIEFLRQNDDNFINSFYVSLTWQDQRLFNKGIAKILRGEK